MNPTFGRYQIKVLVILVGTFPPITNWFQVVSCLRNLAKNGYMVLKNMNLN